MCERPSFPYVVWCVGGTALALWGLSLFDQWFRSGTPEPWNTVRWLGEMAVIILVAWLMDRAGWGPQREQRPPPHSPD